MIVILHNNIDRLGVA